MNPGYYMTGMSWDGMVNIVLGVYCISMYVALIMFLLSKDVGFQYRWGLGASLGIHFVLYGLSVHFGIKDHLFYIWLWECAFYFCGHLLAIRRLILKPGPCGLVNKGLIAAGPMIALFIMYILLVYKSFVGMSGDPGDQTRAIVISHAFLLGIILSAYLAPKAFTFMFKSGSQGVDYISRQRKRISIVWRWE